MYKHIIIIEDNILQYRSCNPHDTLIKVWRTAGKAYICEVPCYGVDNHTAIIIIDGWFSNCNIRI